MSSGTIWGRFVEKTRGQKSRATVPLRELSKQFKLGMSIGPLSRLIKSKKFSLYCPFKLNYMSKTKQKKYKIINVLIPCSYPLSSHATYSHTLTDATVPLNRLFFFFNSSLTGCQALLLLNEWYRKI